jgi:hypothetical protein
MLLLPLALEIPGFLLGERENDFIDHMNAEKQRATALSILNMGVNLLEIAALFSSAILVKIGIGMCFLMVGVLLAAVAVWLFASLEAADARSDRPLPPHIDGNGCPPEEQ